MGGTGRALVTQRPPGCPELVLEPGSDFILGCQKINPKWRETKERATSTPAPHPNRGPKAKSSHETKAKVQRKKESRSLTGWSVFRASAGRRDGGASKQTGPGLSLFVVITFCTSSRRSIMSQAGRSPLSVLPSLCPSVRPSVCPCRAPEKICWVEWGLWSGFRFHRGFAGSISHPLSDAPK